ncbi:unnamed protein product [Brassicogethes aeneus]|uniref:Uncharacterized protein n=1 Tax=Brassicogethes aeneus TaxID=1431903 RepID=A0A9P0AWM3_BRAAE|nr:unnamed protein product [Brassicogethes aeneus]
MISQILVSALLISTVYGVNVTVQHYGKEEITVSITGMEDIKMLPGAVQMVSMEENWSGNISACSEVCDGPKTVAELKLGAEQDQYVVSVVNGFNLPMKLIPETHHETHCKASVCAANVLKMCPEENRVVDSLGNTAACQGVPELLKAVCPDAIVEETERITKEQCCKALGYLVLIG